MLLLRRKAHGKRVMQMRGQKVAGNPTAVQRMVGRELDQNTRAMPLPDQQLSCNMRSESRGIMVRMSPFIGVSHNILRPQIAKQFAQPIRDLCQMKRSLLIGK